MDDLISRQAAIDAADRTDYTGLAVEDVKAVTDEVVKELKKLPSAERHGRWVKGDEMADYPRVPYKSWETYCSCCGAIKEQSNDGFCGNCGARMEVE